MTDKLFHISDTVLEAHGYTKSEINDHDDVDKTDIHIESFTKKLCKGIKVEVMFYYTCKSDEMTFEMKESSTVLTIGDDDLDMVFTTIKELNDFEEVLKSALKNALKQ